VIHDLGVGLGAVFKHAQLRPIVIAHMVWSISGGFFVALYTPFCLRELDLSTATFGVVIAMGGIGSLGGALLSRGLVRNIGLGRTLFATSMLSLACGLFIPLASGSMVATLAFLIAHQLIGDGFAVAFLIQAVTLRQTVLPKRVLGRANAAIHTCTTGLLAISAVIAGQLGDTLGLRPAVWVGVLVGLSAPLALLPLLRLRDMPAATEP
jgi:predicted MFS family arabinose efflux permease